MRQINPLLTLAIAAAAWLLPTTAARAASPAEAAPHIRPARIEPTEGTNLRRITLAERAAQRLDIQTAEVVQDSPGEPVVPYSSIVYDLSGSPWVYINPEPRSFVRHRVSVARID